MEKEKTEFQDVFFKVRFNRFRDVSGSTANEITDREEWDVCECVLRLPAGYSDTGEETPLILSCHGSGSVVCEEEGKTGSVSYCMECTKQGYAVLDVCGSLPDGVTMGCPEHVFALHKAYRYAVKNYNLSSRVLVAGASMGGQTAMNFVHTFPGIVIALGLIYPRLNMNGVTVNGHVCRGSWDKTEWKINDDESARDRIARVYRFPGSEWCEENTVGFNPYRTRSVLCADGSRVVFAPCPIKVWQGTADMAIDPVMVEEFVASVRRGGCYIDLHLMEGVAHKMNDVIRTELAMWFNRFI